MAKRPKNDVLALLKQIKAGIDRPGYIAARRTKLIESIEEHLVLLSPDGLLQVALDLDGLGIVEGVTGVASIWQGNPDGWTALQSSFACSSWNVRICVGLYRLGRLKPGWS